METNWNKTIKEMETNWNKMQTQIFEIQIGIEKDSILNHNSDIKEFIDQSIECDGMNVILIYGVTNSKYMNHIYRMAIYPKESTQSIFRGGDVLDNQGYNVQDVKDMAKVYLGHFINKLNQ
jgi:hypothetical protein